MITTLPRLEPTAAGFRLRLRYGEGKQARFHIPLPDRSKAEARAAKLRALAEDVRELPHAEARVILEAAAGAKTEASFAAIEKAATAELKRPTRHTAEPVTFRQLATLWTSGELARRHPDHVRAKRTADLDEQRFALLNQSVGDIEIASFTLADADHAMSELPDTISPTTRRHYAGLVYRLMRLAVYPCRLREHSPLPSGWLPRSKSSKAKSWLYPSEDAQLLRCSDVPLDRRVLWGFLAREGMRLNEAMGLRWSDVDLERGAVKLDRNKTDDPRAWALRPDVVRALRAFKTDVARESDPIFDPFVDSHVADQFRAHLQKAKIDREELFESSEHRMPIRAHDLRTTFVTISLATGKTETFVADRTGHKSSQMISRYRRAARHAQELGLGELEPLDLAIPGLTPAQVGESGGESEMRGSGLNLASPAGFEPASSP